MAIALRRTLQNPLAVFGLILVAGDGPLVVAYGLTDDPVRAWWLMVFAIAFVFVMGAVFSFLVIFRPRHLFAPGEIPESAFDRPIYSEGRLPDDAAASPKVKRDLLKLNTLYFLGPPGTRRTAGQLRSLLKTMDGCRPEMVNESLLELEAEGKIAIKGPVDSDESLVIRIIRFH